MSDCRAILAVSPVLAWTCRDLLAAHTLVLCYAGHGWESKTLEHGHDGLASWLRGLWCDDYRRRADARMRQPVGRCAAGVRMLLRYRASVLHIMSRRQGLLSGRDRLWILLTRLLLYMHRYSRRANGETDAARYSSHSRLQRAVTSWPRRTNPMPEASWTLCIGGIEMQGHGEVHVVVVPSEDRNRLSPLDWCAATAEPTFRKRMWRARSGDRPTLLHASRACGAHRYTYTLLSLVRLSGHVTLSRYTATSRDPFTPFKPSPATTAPPPQARPHGQKPSNGPLVVAIGHRLGTLADADEETSRAVSGPAAQHYFRL